MHKRPRLGEDVGGATRHDLRPDVMTSALVEGEVSIQERDTGQPLFLPPALHSKGLQREFGFWKEGSKQEGSKLRGAQVGRISARRAQNTKPFFGGPEGPQRL